MTGTTAQDAALAVLEHRGGWMRHREVARALELSDAGARDLLDLLLDARLVTCRTPDGGVLEWRAR